MDFGVLSWNVDRGRLWAGRSGWTDGSGKPRETRRSGAGPFREGSALFDGHPAKERKRDDRHK